MCVEGGGLLVIAWRSISLVKVYPCQSVSFAPPSGRSISLGRVKVYPSLDDEISRCLPTFNRSGGRAKDTTTKGFHGRIDIAYAAFGRLTLSLSLGLKEYSIEKFLWKIKDCKQFTNTIVKTTKHIYIHKVWIFIHKVSYIHKVWIHTGRQKILPINTP